VAPPDLDSDATVKHAEPLTSLIGLGGGEARAAVYTGTKALMLAVLEEAIQSFLSEEGSRRDEAELWVSSRRRSVFSFLVVCETLGLEPSAVRRALHRLRIHQVPAKALARSRPNAGGQMKLSRQAIAK
jgi:hypothetical protein